MPRVPLTMIVPIALLMVAGVALGVAPGVAGAFTRAADQFTDHTGYLAQTLATLAPPDPGPTGAPAQGHWTAAGLLVNGISSVLAAALALGALHRDRLPEPLHRMVRKLKPALDVLRAAHSGHVGDYVAWLFVGLAALCLFVVPG